MYAVCLSCAKSADDDAPWCPLWLDQAALNLAFAEDPASERDWHVNADNYDLVPPEQSGVACIDLALTMAGSSPDENSEDWLAGPHSLFAHMLIHTVFDPTDMETRVARVFERATR